MNKLLVAAGASVIGLVLLFGLFLLLKGLRNVQLALASTQWPTTAGAVLRSETTRTVTPGNRKTAASVTFNTQTVVRYNVNGRDYTTDVLHFGQTLGSSDKSEAALQRLRFPEGKPVTVSYNPANPGTAVLRPGLHTAAFWLPGAGLAFLLPAVLCLFLIPVMMRTFTEPNPFAASVDQAMEAARSGRPIPPVIPPDSGGDRVMSFAAAGFGAVACCLGLLALTAGLQRMWHGSASQSWPTTRGVVIIANKGGGEDGGDAHDDSTDSAAAVRFVYQYEVRGVTHFSNLRRFAQVEGGSEVEAVSERYRKGATVKVSYFPTDPDVAVLEPGNSGASFWLPGIGVVLILFALAVFKWVVPGIARP